MCFDFDYGPFCAKVRLSSNIHKSMNMRKIKTRLMSERSDGTRWAATPRSRTVIAQRGV